MSPSARTEYVVESELSASFGKRIDTTLAQYLDVLAIVTASSLALSGCPVRHGLPLSFMC